MNNYLEKVEIADDCGLPQELGYILHGYCLHGLHPFALSPPPCRRGAGAGKKLLGTAYNGAPMGVPDCSEAGCMVSEQYEREMIDGVETMVKKQRCIRTIHAEQNLLLFTDRSDREGSTVYVTDEPCWTCANMLANSGIVEIVYLRPYKKDMEKVQAMLTSKGIVFRQLENYEPPKETMISISE